MKKAKPRSTARANQQLERLVQSNHELGARIERLLATLDRKRTLKDSIVGMLSVQGNGVLTWIITIGLAASLPWQSEWLRRHIFVKPHASIGRLLYACVAALLELGMFSFLFWQINSGRRRAKSFGPLTVFGVQFLWSVVIAFSSMMALAFFNGHSPNNIRFDIVVSVVGIAAAAYNFLRAKFAAERSVGVRVGVRDLLSCIERERPKLGR